MVFVQSTDSHMYISFMYSLVLLNVWRRKLANIQTLFLRLLLLKHRALNTFTFRFLFEFFLLSFEFFCFFNTMAKAWNRTKRTIYVRQFHCKLLCDLTTIQCDFVPFERIKNSNPRQTFTRLFRLFCVSIRNSDRICPTLNNIVSIAFSILKQITIESMIEWAETRENESQHNIDFSFLCVFCVRLM